MYVLPIFVIMSAIMVVYSIRKYTYYKFYVCQFPANEPYRKQAEYGWKLCMIICIICFFITAFGPLIIKLYLG